MIYETEYFVHDSNHLWSRDRIKAYLESIGFINIPNPSPGYGEDPARYYWNKDTRREFYLHFPNLTSDPNIYAHVVSNGEEYDFRLSPWHPGGGMGDIMATYTPLYNGGIRFGMRARRECLFEFYNNPYNLAVTDYKVGYNDEEIDASFYPANWFAIIAPENEGDEWVYVIFQKKISEVETGETGHYVTDFQNPVLYFHDEIKEPSNTINGSVMNEWSAHLGLTYALMPYASLESNRLVKLYNNVYEVIADSRYKFNKVIDYNTEQYICLSGRGPFVRFR